MIAYGTVVSARAAVIEAKLPAAKVGAGVRISCARGPFFGTVAALCGGTIRITPHGSVEGVGPGDPICTDARALEAPLGLCSLGRAYDANGDPIDARKRGQTRNRRIDTAAPSPASRRAVTQPFWTGVAAIDALLTVGTGARIGIFGPAGAGKSTLLHALTRACGADAVVVGLVGERGREAEEWLRAAPVRATMFCSTGDRSAPERVRAARLAMAQATQLRMRGLHVLLILDSFARFAAAQREIALAAGESVGRGGYPPRVFAELAAFAEMAGAFDRGSITLFATVLNDGDERDPVSEAARAMFDGHLQLCAELAGAAKFPAIDLLRSVSRTMHTVAAAEQIRDAAIVRAAIASLERTKDARAIGMMPSEAGAARAAEHEEAIERFLRDTGICAPHATRENLRALAAILRAKGEPWSCPPD